jgi:hypothetical protein
MKLTLFAILFAGILGTSVVAQAAKHPKHAKKHKTHTTARGIDTARAHGGKAYGNGQTKTLHPHTGTPRTKAQ